MDYKKALRLHFVNKLSGKDVAANCGCSKTTANEFFRRFNECLELSYPLPEDVTNEYIEKLVVPKLFRDSALCGEVLRRSPGKLLS